MQEYIDQDCHIYHTQDPKDVSACFLLDEKSWFFHFRQSVYHKALAYYRGWGWKTKLRIFYLKNTVKIFYKLQ